MADAAVHAETGAAQKTSETGNASNNADAAKANEQAEKPLTKSELASILGEFRNGINADIRKATSKPAEKKVEAEVDTTLTARVKRIEEIAARQRERERLSAVRTALVDGGVPANKAEREARLILMDHASKIEVNEDSFQVTYRESEDKATPVAEWIGAYLKTDEGKALFPAKATNGAVEGGAAKAQAQGPHPFDKLTYKEIMDHKDYVTRDKWIHANREKWEEKKRNRT